MGESEDKVRRYLDAGIKAKLNIGGCLGLVLFVGLGPAVFVLLMSNRDFARFVPFYLVGLVGLYLVTYGRLAGSADREGIRRSIGFKKRWADLQGKESKMESFSSRDKQGRRHTETFKVTTYTFTSGRLTFSDRFLRNGKQLETFAAIAAAHAQPAKFGDELQTEDARAALAAFAALPPGKQGPGRSALAGAGPWIVAVLALAVTGLLGRVALKAWTSARDEEQMAETTEYPDSRARHLERAAEKREDAGTAGIRVGVAGLVAASAIAGGVLGQAAHRRRRRALDRTTGRSSG